MSCHEFVYIARNGSSLSPDPRFPCSPGDILGMYRVADVQSITANPMSYDVFWELERTPGESQVLDGVAARLQRAGYLTTRSSGLVRVDTHPHLIPLCLCDLPSSVNRDRTYWQCPRADLSRYTHLAPSECGWRQPIQAHHDTRNRYREELAKLSRVPPAAPGWVHLSPCVDCHARWYRSVYSGDRFHTLCVDCLERRVVSGRQSVISSLYQNTIEAFSETPAYHKSGVQLEL